MSELLVKRRRGFDGPLSPEGEKPGSTGRAPDRGILTRAARTPDDAPPKRPLFARCGAFIQRFLECGLDLRVLGSNA